MGICATPDCGKDVRARGFCPSCYYRHLRHGDLLRGSESPNFKHRLSEVDEENKRAVCLVCGPTKITARSKSPDGSRRWRCSTYANHRAKLYKQAYRQQKKDMMLPHCEVCGTKEKLNWDHDHSTGEFRGTLCTFCNCSLGLLREDPETIRKLANYIETWQTRTNT